MQAHTAGATPTPYFMADIHTGEASVDGEYQVAQFALVIAAAGVDAIGINRVRCVVTDNAAVMKIWDYYELLCPAINSCL